MEGRQPSFRCEFWTKASPRDAVPEVETPFCQDTKTAIARFAGFGVAALPLTEDSFANVVRGSSDFGILLHKQALCSCNVLCPRACRHDTKNKQTWVDGSCGRYDRLEQPSCCMTTVGRGWRVWPCLTWILHERSSRTRMGTCNCRSPASVIAKRLQRLGCDPV
ncbi:hypothetical protein N657DRAFT_179796 [Parathielavia appendiculata]|uniref:Uncharacterized protein n=1 Tax=Parathielavia appendiculata TaxID=2587402 RepID=A0AAN6U5K9_9PEZI|nr:hypothetical protein N657DRAFT_179796 [Parathielavia appendiculata]